MNEVVVTARERLSSHSRRSVSLKSGMLKAGIKNAPLSRGIRECRDDRGPVCSVFPVKTDQLALNLHPVGWQDTDFIGGIGRLQRD